MAEKSKMEEVGALLLSVGGAAEEEKDKGESYEDTAEPESVARDAMRAFLDAQKADDVDGALTAFRLLYRVCPLLPEEDSEKDEEQDSEHEYGEE